MAFFDVNPVDGTNVVIAAASTGNRARFIAFGCCNRDTATRRLRLYDGATTVRTEFALTAGSTMYFVIDTPGHSIFPKVWWTSGSAIECDLDGTGDVRVFGEVVREV